MEHEEGADPVSTYPVAVTVAAQTEERNRLTAFFRFFLAIPHLILVGGPPAVVGGIGWSTDNGWDWTFGAGGVLSAVACVCAMIAWFAILFTGRHPDGLWKLTAFYMRWRVRAIAYATLLRDEYPPFGDGEYPVGLVLPVPEAERDKVTVLLRFFLVLPHLIVLWLLSMVWAFTTALAWIAILLTGRYPQSLYGFAVGVLAWGTRVEAYALLLRDEYPPFTLRA